MSDFVTDGTPIPGIKGDGSEFTPTEANSLRSALLNLRSYWRQLLDGETPELITQIFVGTTDISAAAGNFVAQWSGPDDPNASISLAGYTGSGTVTNVVGKQIKAATNTGGGTVTNAIGLWIEQQTVGGTNYQIKCDGPRPFNVMGDGSVTMFGGSGVSRVAVPSTATSTGTLGQMAWDATYLYVCTATDTWKRVAVATW